MNELTHFDETGASRMVDVGSKPITQRVARASARIRMQLGTLTRIRDKAMSKGDVLEVARLAGIMAAKRTSDLIPLCHPLALESVTINFEFVDDTTVVIQSQAQITAKTGVEMEALVAASTAALTVYDMCKSIDRSMTIESIRVEEKSGGKSGHFVREEEASESDG